MVYVFSVSVFRADLEEDPEPANGFQAVDDGPLVFGIPCICLSLCESSVLDGPGRALVFVCHLIDLAEGIERSDRHDLS